MVHASRGVHGRRGRSCTNGARSRRDLEATEMLEPFEVAQLGNLCPEDAQEARALIPSLDMPGRQIDNAQLNEVLAQLASYKQHST